MNRLNHIAFIMDGNGRWGEKKGKGRNYGHLKGVETVKKIVKESIKLNIPIIKHVNKVNNIIANLIKAVLFHIFPNFPLKINNL